MCSSYYLEVTCSSPSGLLLFCTPALLKLQAARLLQRGAESGSGRSTAAEQAAAASRAGSGWLATARCRPQQSRGALGRGRGVAGAQARR